MRRRVLAAVAVAAVLVPPTVSLAASPRSERLQADATFSALTRSAGAQAGEAAKRRGAAVERAPGDRLTKRIPVLNRTPRPRPTPTPTATPVPPPPAPPPAPAPDGIVRRSGGALTLDGQPYRFTGINAYSAATWWGMNWGCGGVIYDIDGMFRQLRPNSMVRFWAYQAQGFNNKSTWRLDFEAIDRVVAAAERNKQRLIFTLSDQSGTCDDGKWHDQAWYDGGYAQRYNDDGRGLGAVSYLEWVRIVVDRYKNSPAVGMWEPVNEPEASNCYGATGSHCYHAQFRQCPPGAANSLRAFFDRIGGEIKRIDPKHLVSSGVIGGGHCGMNGGEYEHIHNSPAIDVATFHDYGNDGVALPGEVAMRLDQARRIGKPLIVEEVGMAGQHAGPCNNQFQRRDLFAAKMRASFDSGAAGYLPWWYAEGSGGGCNHQITPDDPTMALLRDIRLF